MLAGSDALPLIKRFTPRYKFQVPILTYNAWHTLSNFDFEWIGVIQSFWFRPVNQGYSNSICVPFKEFCNLHPPLNAREPAAEGAKPKTVTAHDRQRAFVVKYGSKFQGTRAHYHGSHVC